MNLHLKSSIAVIILLALWLTPVYPISAGLGQTQPAWEGQIAYVGADGNLWLLRGENPQPFQITSDASEQRRYGSPVFSPKGDMLLGRSVTQHKQVSDVTAHVIDEEIRILIDGNYQRAKEILTRDMDKLHKMAEALIKFETIDEEQIRDIMQARDPRPPADWEDRDLPSSGSTPRERRDGEAPSGRPAPQH